MPWPQGYVATKIQVVKALDDNPGSSTDPRAPRDTSRSGPGRGLMTVILPALLMAYVAVPLVVARSQ